MHSNQQPLYLNIEEANRYNQDPWSKHLQHGLFFSSMQKYQQNINFKISVNGKTIEFLHSIYDGFSALKSIEKHYKLGLVLTKPLSSKKITNKQKLIYIYNYFKTNRNSKFRFKRINLELIGNTIQSQIILTESQTQTLLQSLKKRNQSLTSSFIHKSNEIISKELLSINTKTPWMIPVNLRGEIKSNSKMLSSFIRVNCLKSDKEISLKLKISKSLKAKEYLGLYFLGSMSLKLGRAVINSITKIELAKKNPKWFASFSNLGNIKGSAKNSLIITPTIRFQRPIGIVTYIFNRKLHITLNFDQSIANEREIKRIKDEFYKSII